MVHQQNSKPARARQIALLDNLVDIVQDRDGRKFLFADGRVAASVEAEDEVLIPATGAALSCVPPRLGLVKEFFTTMQAGHLDSGDIFDAVVTVLPSYSRLPTSDYYDLFAAFALHSYRLDLFNYSPILFLYGVAERGKSRTGKALAYISYRGVVTETLNQAPLFRLAEGAEPTMFIDVVNLMEKAQKQDALDIINARYERGPGVLRVLKPEETGLEAIQSFRIFGPTIVATNFIPEERLLTRGLLVVMPEAEGHFSEPVQSELRHLREMLTAFRWWSMRNGVQVDGGVDGLGSGRWRDITKPLRQMTALAAHDRLPVVDRALEHLYAQRMAEKAQDPDAFLVQAVINLQELGLGASDLSTQALKEAFREASGWSSVSDKYIGSHMVALGFQPVYVNEGGRKQRGYRSDTQLAERLRAKYGLPEEAGTNGTDLERITSHFPLVIHVGGNGWNR